MRSIDTNNISYRENGHTQNQSKNRDSLESTGSVSDKNITDPQQSLAKEVLQSLKISTIEQKQRKAVGILLKQTLEKLSSDTLLSINTAKAILTAKQILPTELGQLILQDRVSQEQIAQQIKSQIIKPPLLTNNTVNQWFSGQLLQTIVYQATQNNYAQLLVPASGQFQFTQDSLSELTSSNISNKLLKQAQVIKINSNLDLSIGQQLLVQVKKEQQVVSFELKHSPNESAKISQFINQTINKQQPLNTLLAAFKEIQMAPQQSQVALSEKFVQQLSQINQQIPNLNQLNSSEKIIQAIRSSGVFLEASLLNSIKQSPLSLDLFEKNQNGTLLTASGSATSLSSTAKNNSLLNHFPSLSLNSVISQENINNKSPNQTNPFDFKAALIQLIESLNNKPVQLSQFIPNEANKYQNIATSAHLNPLLTKKINLESGFNLQHAAVKKVLLNHPILPINNPLLSQTKLLALLEGNVSRIVLGQLQTRESSDQAFINFEIPFRHNDRLEILQLKLRQQSLAQNTTDENSIDEKIWTVNLAFHLETLGEMRIYISLNKKELDFQIWTEQRRSQKIIEQYSFLLTDRLVKQGFSIHQFSVFHGIPETAQKEQETSTYLLDEQV